MSGGRGDDDNDNENNELRVWNERNLQNDWLEAFAGEINWKVDPIGIGAWGDRDDRTCRFRCVCVCAGSA